MARPSTHADLTAHERRGDTIVRFEYSMLKYPAVAQCIVSAQLAAAKHGLIADETGIYDVPTASELDGRLARAQKRWDDLKAKYDVAIEFGMPESGTWEIREFAQDNGLPEPDTNK